ncbi:MAG: Cobalt/magnesium transport protein CorA [Candidatus Anoxychlamydiales bacterium]|nr:Cobalt/magnesium transport protein CorA [Candidatus Anoxychlamydiales bacterium]
MIDIYFKSLKGDKFEKISDFKAGSWINIYNTTMDDLNKIAEVANLDLDHILDTIDRYEIPRIEHVDSNVAIYCRHSSDNEEGLHTMTLSVIITKNHIITICPYKSHIIDNLINSKTNITTTQKSKLLLFLLLKITQDFTTKIKKVRNIVIEQEYKMKNVTNEAIVLLTNNEEILNQYLASLIPLRNLLEATTTGRYIALYDKDYDILQDLMIAIKQSEDICTLSIKSIRSLRDAYQILFTNSVNKTIKLLTAITIIFTIPTIISSIYGMNISLPLASNPHAFFIIMNITILISLICIYVFVRKKWL